MHDSLSGKMTDAGRDTDRDTAKRFFDAVTTKDIDGETAVGTVDAISHQGATAMVAPAGEPEAVGSTGML